MDVYLVLWLLFLVISLILFYLDFRFSVLNPHEIGLRESLMLCSIWIFVALLFGGFVFYFLGSDKFAEYLTAYIIEYSLSVDNMFVFLMIFKYFGVERKHQAKVLVIGILSAVVMRLVFIFAGIELIKRFSWLLYVFGLVLIYTGIKMFFSRDENVDIERNIVLKLLRKHIKMHLNMEEGRFFVKEAGRYIPTMMFAVLLLIETTDLIFAIDSIPAVLSISQDRLIVYSSNIFAVVGLRSLYFSLSALHDYFRYLKQGVSVALVYVGLKMFLSHFVHITPFFSLTVVIVIIATSIIVSIASKKN